MQTGTRSHILIAPAFPPDKVFRRYPIRGENCPNGHYNMRQIREQRNSTSLPGSFTGDPERQKEQLLSYKTAAISAIQGVQKQ
jgi:hypothetical protein